MKTRTVFILGAGSSAPYGLPTGGELAREVAGAVAAIGGREAKQAIIDHEGDTDGILEERYAGEAARLADRICRSQTETIDDYIVAQAPTDAARITQGMIDVLWQKETDSARANAAPTEGNWIAWLYHNRLLKQKEMFAKNQVVFVSFNYDRLPRLFMATMMANLYQTSIQDCWEAVGGQVLCTGARYRRFVHPHGVINHEPVADPGGATLNAGYHPESSEHASDGIRIMGDNRDLNPWFYDNLWAWAERICFLGLGYHETLMQRIGMTHEKITTLAQSGKYVGGTGYKLTPLQREAVMARASDNFQLGPADQDCLAYLQHALRDVE